MRTSTHMTLIYGVVGFVSVAPEIDIGRSEYVVTKGSPAQLDCDARGNPPPIIRWVK